MAQMFVCDLCGKPLPKDGAGTRSFRIQEYKSFWDHGSWTPIDVHEKCIEKLYATIKGNSIMKFSVVKCKDCKYGRKDNLLPINLRYCELHEYEQRIDDYCSDGVMK